MLKGFILYKIVTYSIANARKVMWISILISLVLAVAIPAMKIDVDPENMLSPNDPTRIYHNKMKKMMDIHDMIAIGISNDKDKMGVFNPQTLKHIYELSNFARTLTWKDPKDETKEIGVIPVSIYAPSQLDAVEAGKDGSIVFDRLLKLPPTTQAEADTVLARSKADPILRNFLVSQDGKSMSIYLPLSSKTVSYKVHHALEEKIASFKGNEVYHITGLPLAQDTFGIEMFIQMGISVPFVMLLIFSLIYLFFRSSLLAFSAVLLSLLTTMITVGLFVLTGHTVHIMSSMIPIFLAPIAVLDAVHILSHFYDEYCKTNDRVAAINSAMSSLWKPMLFTSVTSAVGFASLAFAPIPPIQAFGIFVGIGILVAWFLSMTMLPAFIMLLKEGSLHSLQARSSDMKFSKILSGLGMGSYKHSRLIVVISIGLFLAAFYGMGKLIVNDNPMHWLNEKHPVRMADNFLNENFTGSYMLYLNLSQKKHTDVKGLNEKVLVKIKKRIEVLPEGLEARLIEISASSEDTIIYFQEVREYLSGKQYISTTTNFDEVNIEDDEDSIFGNMDTFEEMDERWMVAAKTVEEFRHESEFFKDPRTLNFLLKMQKEMLDQGVVSGINSIADLITKVNMELHEGKEEFRSIPPTESGVAEDIISFESSHYPWRLNNLITTDYQNATVWLQLKSGDNQDVMAVVKAVNTYLDKHAHEIEVEHSWYGLSYINVKWQENMVSGMRSALLSSLVMVALMMIFLFRSIFWGIVSVIPLIITLAFIYGMLGFIGKDYDMPIAVLSALSLGMSVDFAIHFITQLREDYAYHGSWKIALEEVFQEPARAIARNIVIISLGFSPLLFAALIPYQTVGIVMMAIMLISGIATLVLLPAIVNLKEKTSKKEGKCKS